MSGACAGTPGLVPAEARVLRSNTCRSAAPRAGDAGLAAATQAAVFRTPYTRACCSCLPSTSVAASPPSRQSPHPPTLLHRCVPPACPCMQAESPRPSSAPTPGGRAAPLHGCSVARTMPANPSCGPAEPLGNTCVQQAEGVGPAAAAAQRGGNAAARLLRFASGMPVSETCCCGELIALQS